MNLPRQNDTIVLCIQFIVGWHWKTSFVSQTFLVLLLLLRLCVGYGESVNLKREKCQKWCPTKKIEVKIQRREPDLKIDANLVANTRAIPSWSVEWGFWYIFHRKNEHWCKIESNWEWVERMKMVKYQSMKSMKLVKYQSRSAVVQTRVANRRIFWLT